MNQRLEALEAESGRAVQLISTESERFAAKVAEETHKMYLAGEDFDLKVSEKLANIDQVMEKHRAAGNLLHSEVTSGLQRMEDLNQKIDKGQETIAALMSDQFTRFDRHCTQKLTEIQEQVAKGEHIQQHIIEKVKEIDQRGGTRSAGPSAGGADPMQRPEGHDLHG